jgi:PleD family two-component response regulator
MDRAPKTKVLVAVIPENEERVQRILAGHELTFARNREHAWSLLEKERFGLVVVSVHFDESQMFSLLADIRAHAKYRKVPILCALASQGRVLSDVAIEGLDHAVKAMMANGFLNLLNIADDEEGNARVRRIVDYLILLDGDLQHIARSTGASADGPPETERRRSK